MSLIRVARSIVHHVAKRHSIDPENVHEAVGKSLQRPPSYLPNYIGYTWSAKAEYNAKSQAAKVQQVRADGGHVLVHTILVRIQSLLMDDIVAADGGAHGIGWP